MVVKDGTNNSKTYTWGHRISKRCAPRRCTYDGCTSEPHINYAWCTKGVDMSLIDLLYVCTYKRQLNQTYERWMTSACCANVISSHYLKFKMTFSFINNLISKSTI